MDAKSIVNLGLGKIAASRVSSLAPPKSPVERHCADGYPSWRDEELAKREWVFAKDVRALVLVDDNADILGDGRKYKFVVPTDCIRVLRSKHATWLRRGSFIFNYDATLTIEIIKRASEAEFDPLFVNVLAGRVAVESVEFATQSNTKAQAIQTMHYDPAVDIAAKQNAFVIGTQDIGLADEHSDWIMARYTGYPH